MSGNHPTRNPLAKKQPVSLKVGAYAAKAVVLSGLLSIMVSKSLSCYCSVELNYRKRTKKLFTAKRNFFCILFGIPLEMPSSGLS
jgi:hypothetical protein